MISSPVANQPLVTTYGYDNGGRLTSTTYSDSTPAVSITYDALGRQITQSNGLATSEFTYDPATLAPDTETITYTLPGADPFVRIIDRSQDTLGRDTGFQLKTENSTLENSATYTYGTTDGRLASVAGASGSGSFQYGYTANSNLVATITGPAHTVTNTWEATRNVLDMKENKVGTIEISTYDYSVNAIGQRTSVATSGTAFSGAAGWNWAYDSLGQVTLAEHGTNSNFHRSYAYDAIGNRQQAAAGTLDVNDISAAVYTANALNQYSSINDPQSTILNPVHDADGNMTSGPLPVDPESASSLTWDAENRLISAIVDTTTVTYTYDAQSRRIATTVGTNTTLVVYDAWNPVAEWSADLQSATLTKTYTWGMDISGSMQGAGGVGGLLVVTDHGSLSTDHFYPTYDGNGNVSEYLDDAGTPVAHYEYDPFGRIVVESGSQAADFAHRFSTKPVDSVTGLLYYGYRWYDPVTGRWPSRDPIEESGGINLYGFVGNNGLGNIDILGLRPSFSYKWAGDPAKGGPFYENGHIWIAAWLQPEGLKQGDSGYVIEKFNVNVIKLEKCDGTPAGMYSGATADVWTLIPFGKNAKLPANVGQALPIYTVFVNTRVPLAESDFTEINRDCNKGEISITWTAYLYLDDNPNRRIDDFMDPLHTRDAGLRGHVNEIQHKYWTEFDPIIRADRNNPNAVVPKAAFAQTMTMTVSWDYCGFSFSRRMMTKNPDWPVMQRRAGPH